MKILTVIFTSFFAFIFTAHFASATIKWIGDWAYGCDFNENDLKNVQMGREFCGLTCESISECTHYTWNNGTCSMKQGQVTRANAFETNDNNMICGISSKTFDNNDHGGSNDSSDGTQEAD